MTTFDGISNHSCKGPSELVPLRTRMGSPCGGPDFPFIIALDDGCGNPYSPEPPLQRVVAPVSCVMPHDQQTTPQKCHP